ncbi:RNA-directed DNA polymerase from mobile element jockey [Trichonephila inaurata madagascariensis]|uniref:RNA-directed DNA polymerase from mobile element jockey n=1 Tax=Trichonephila inaurata madagascariensis TaxID=2747483 RepID=A0A8X6XWX6_9ARAC|nr:RNA-directed DNA polymerase from mobile element jockey [Trichonephila inaurata madagascariensis]
MPHSANSPTPAPLKTPPATSFPPNPRMASNTTRIPQQNGNTLITVIPKAGKDPRFADNYRPISVISSLGKIFEKILLNHINKGCEDNNRTPDFQHGFRQRTSTHQLLCVTNLIINGFNNRTYTVGLFLDEKKPRQNVALLGTK